MQNQDVEVRLRLALEGLPEANRQVLELAAAAGNADSRLKSLEQVMSRKKAVGDGSFTRGARADLEVARLARETSFAERRAAVGDGTRSVLQKRQLDQKDLDTRILERRAELQALYGRTGGGVAHGMERLGENRFARLGAGMALGAAGWAAAAGTSGFSGTVEGNRLALEMQLLNREIAGALRPAIVYLTDTVRGIRQWLQRQGRGTQNLIAAGTVGTLGLTAAGVFSRNVLGMGLAQAAGAGIAGVTGTAARLGLGTLAGQAAGGLAVGTGTSLAAGAAPRLATAIPLSGPGGAAAASGTTLATRAAVPAASSAAGTAVGAAAAGGGVGLGATLSAVAAGGAISGFQHLDMISNFERRAQSGVGGHFRNVSELAISSNPLTSIAAGALKAGDRAASGLVGWATGREMPGLLQGDSSLSEGLRRLGIDLGGGKENVTLAGGGFGEIGSSFDRFVMAGDQVTANNDDKQTSLLERIEENTRKDATPAKREG